MAQPEVARAVQASVDRCSWTGERGLAYDAAVALGELLEAEEAGFVGLEWREPSRAHVAEALIVAENDNVEAEWARDLRHLNAMLDSGLVGSEEAALVLHLRSNLESASRFVRGDVRGRLAVVDKDLPRLFARNAAAFRASHGRQRANLAKRLPGHWWWARARG